MSISFSPGTIIDDRYSIIEQLGAGGMGTVFKASEVGLDRLIALKVLHSTLVGDRQNQTRFQREGRALGTLRHGNIIQLYRFGIWNKTFPYIAMEFFEGRSLLSVLEKETRLSSARVLAIALQVCNAMEAAHAAGVVHRDLSPANIMLPLDSDSPCKVIDFGLSMLAKSDVTADQKLTSTGTVVGSIYYMSPEQCTGSKADQRSDIYSLGCVLYNALTGTPPFTGDNPIALMRQHASAYPKNLSDQIPAGEIPAGLNNALFRAMEKSPDKRYQTMRAFRADLELIVAGAGGLIDPPSNLSRTEVNSQRTMPVALASLLLITVVLTLPVMMQQKPFGKANRGKLATQPSEEKSTLRRLRQPAELCGLPAEERISYYRNWLASYPKDKSIDAAIARQDLAFNLENKFPDSYLDARILYSQAFRLCPDILDQSLKVRDPALAEIAVRTAFNCGKNANEPGTKKVLLDMLSKLESSGATGMLRAANGCREYITDISMEDGDYVTAEKMLRAELKSHAEAAVLPKDHLRPLISLAKCLTAANRQSEAKTVLVDAVDFASKNVQEMSDMALDIARRCLKANLLPQCITAANLAIGSTRNGEDEKVFIEACELKANAMESMHEYEKSFRFLSEQLQRLRKLEGRLAWWYILCRLNYEGQLKKEEQLKQILAHEVTLVPQSNPEKAVEAICQAARKSAGAVRRGGNNALAIDIVSIAASTNIHWKTEKMPELLDAIIPLAAEAKPLSNGELSLKLYNLAKTKIDGLPDSYVPRARLALFYANQFGMPPNCEKAIEELNPFIEGDSAKHEQLKPRVFLALRIARSRMLTLLNRLTEARRDAEKSIVLARTIVKDQLPLALADLAHLEFISKKPEKAETLYREALRTCDPACIAAQTRLRLALAQVYIVQGRFTEAEVLLQECLKSEKTEHIALLHFQTRERFLELYSLSGQKEKAAQWRKFYEEAKSALFNPPAFPK